MEDIDHHRRAMEESPVVDGRDSITERVPGMNQTQRKIGARLLRNETWGKRQAVMTEPGSSAGSDGSRDPSLWGQLRRRSSHSHRAVRWIMLG